MREKEKAVVRCPQEIIYGKTGDGKIPTAMIRPYRELASHDIYSSIYL
jgi:hypothetical protein